MLDPVAVASGFPGPPAWVFLDSFESIGDCRNATTATGFTSARRAVQVSFLLVDPPGVSRWFVHCLGLKKKRGLNGPPYILNIAGSLVFMHMMFFRGGDGCVFDYFVYRVGPGKPSLNLIPGSCPQIGFPKAVGVLARGAGGEHYAVVFRALRSKARIAYEMRVFSLESRAWSTKVARISADPETTYDEVVMHHPRKVVAAGGSSLAWIDLWQGILVCDRFDKDDDDPVMRLIKWTVPSSRDDVMDLYATDGGRDAMLSDGVITFVQIEFHYEYDGVRAYGSRHAMVDTGWTSTATVWKRDTSSNDWNMSFKAVDIVNILASHLISCSDLLQKAVMQNEFDADQGKCFMRGVQMFNGTPMGKLPAATKVNVLNAMSRSMRVDFNSSSCITAGPDILAKQAVTDIGKWACIWVTVAWGFLFRVLFYLTILLGSRNKRS